VTACLASNHLLILYCDSCLAAPGETAANVLTAIPAPGEMRVHTTMHVNRSKIGRLAKRHALHVTVGKNRRLLDLGMGRE